MYPFLLALFAAVCWGLAPFFGKIGLRGVGPVAGLGARTLITVIMVEAWVLARGGISQMGAIPGRRWWYLAAEAFFATFIGDLAYYGAIKWGEISMAGLVLAASPLVTLWAGWYFLNEQMSPLKVVGALFIITGVILVGIQASR